MQHRRYLQCRSIGEKRKHDAHCRCLENGKKSRILLVKTFHALSRFIFILFYFPIASCLSSRSSTCQRVESIFLPFIYVKNALNSSMTFTHHLTISLSRISSLFYQTKLKNSKLHVCNIFNPENHIKNLS